MVSPILISAADRRLEAALWATWAAEDSREVMVEERISALNYIACDDVIIKIGTRSGTVMTHSRTRTETAGPAPSP